MTYKKAYHWLYPFALALTLLTWNGCRLPVPEAPPAPEKTKPLIIAHYMTWFGLPERSGAWFQWKFNMGGIPTEKFHDPEYTLPDGRRDIAVVHHPVIGPYDSTDPDVLEYHILLAKAAGIDGFMVNWYGFEDSNGNRRHEDLGFEQLLRVAARLDFKACINLDDKCAFGGYRQCETRQSAVDFGKATLLRVMTNHAASTAYLRIDGRPVLSNFGSMYASGRSLDETSFAPVEWAEIIQSLADHKPFFIHDHQWHWRKSIEEAGFLSSADSIFPWIGIQSDRIAFLQESKKLLDQGKMRLVTGIANPGFDNTPCQGWGGGLNVVPRNDGAEFREEFEESLKYGAGFIQLATWNDFTEGSTIEPTDEYGDQYLRITAEYANRFFAKPVYGKCLDLPKQIYDLRKLAEEIEGNKGLPPESITALRAATDSAVEQLVLNDRAGCEKAIAKARALAAGRAVREQNQLTVRLGPGSETVFAGESADLQLEITNPSTTGITVRLAMYARGIPREWLSVPESVDLAPGQSLTSTVKVQAPEGTESREGWIAVNVYTEGRRDHSNLSHIRVIRSHLRAEVGFLHLLQPGKKQNMTLRVDSLQKRSESATITFYPPPGWTATPTQVVQEISSNGVVVIPFTLEPGPDAAADGVLKVQLARGEREQLIKVPVAIRSTDMLLMEGDVNGDGAIDLVLGNDALELHGSPDLGGRILSIINRTSGKPQLFVASPWPAKSSGQWEEYGGINDTFPGEWPGDVWNSAWNRELVDPEAGETCVALRTQTGNGLLIRKRIAIRTSTSDVRISYEIANTAGVLKPAAWASHPDLTPGGSAGPEDVMVVPVAGDHPGETKLVTTEFQKTKSKTSLAPSENWILAYDRDNKEYIGQAFDRKILPDVGMWQDNAFFTMELSGPKWTLKPGEKKTFQVSYHIGQGSLDDAIAAMRALSE